MTPKRLLADLMRQGFRLAACGNNIEVAPTSQLTESVRQDIRKHKGELLTLLGTEGSLEGQVLLRGKDRQKTRRLVPAKKSPVRPNDNSGKVGSASKSEVGASMPADIQ